MTTLVWTASNPPRWVDPFFFDVTDEQLKELQKINVIERAPTGWQLRDSKDVLAALLAWTAE